MSVEKVEFRFPDESGGSDDIEISLPEDSTPEPEEKAEKPAKAEKPEVEIEVVDDTPAKDRGRKPSEPPAEVTDDELADYSDKVKKRIQHFSKGYHDERRAKEAAQREKEELERIARVLTEENNRLKGTVTQNQEVLLEQAKRVVTGELEQAKVKYKQAYEAGDADALTAAQEAITAATIKADRVNNLKLPSLQTAPVNVQPEVTAPARPAADEKASSWQQENPWFGKDDEMTAFALGLHQKLVKEGVNPRSDEYYERINSRMRQVFPDNFEDALETPAEKPRRKPASVVAPATRSTAPRKITLTQTQVAIAKRLGVPIELYAQKVAEEMRKQNG